MRGEEKEPERARGGECTSSDAVRRRRSRGMTAPARKEEKRTGGREREGGSESERPHVGGFREMNFTDEQHARMHLPPILL